MTNHMCPTRSSLKDVFWTASLMIKNDILHWWWGDNYIDDGAYNYSGEECILRAFISGTEPVSPSGLVKHGTPQKLTARYESSALSWSAAKTKMQKVGARLKVQKRLHKTTWVGLSARAGSCFNQEWPTLWQALHPVLHWPVNFAISTPPLHWSMCDPYFRHRKTSFRT